MAKKKETQKIQRNLLSKDEFISYKSAIAALSLASAKLEQTRLQHKNLALASEISYLKSKLFGLSEVNIMMDQEEMLKKEYFKVKQDIELALGYSLNGKIIDEITQTVK